MSKDEGRGRGGGADLRGTLLQCTYHRDQDILRVILQQPSQ